MTEQLTMEQAFAVRTEAIGRADDHADAEWKAAAAACVEQCAATCADFTADDVWARLDADFPHLATHEPSALGPVFLRASRAGAIVKVPGVLRPSRYGRRHRDLTVWRADAGATRLEGVAAVAVGVVASLVWAGWLGPEIAAMLEGVGL
jgi:hypothetical protein